jgi:hypothetical protein
VPSFISSTAEADTEAATLPAQRTVQPADVATAKAYVTSPPAPRFQASGTITLLLALALLGV